MLKQVLVILCCGIVLLCPLKSNVQPFGGAEIIKDLYGKEEARFSGFGKGIPIGNQASQVDSDVLAFPHSIEMLSIHCFNATGREFSDRIMRISAARMEHHFCGFVGGENRKCGIVRQWIRKKNYSAINLHVVRRGLPGIPNLHYGTRKFSDFKIVELSSCTPDICSELTKGCIVHCSNGSSQPVPLIQINEELQKTNYSSRNPDGFGPPSITRLIYLFLTVPLSFFIGIWGFENFYEKGKLIGVCILICAALLWVSGYVVVTGLFYFW